MEWSPYQSISPGRRWCAARLSFAPAPPAALEADALRLPFPRWELQSGDVKQTYSHEPLGKIAGRARLDVVDHTRHFRGRQDQHCYLAMSSVKGKAAAIAAPLVSATDKRLPNDRGSVVLVRARNRSG